MNYRDKFDDNSCTFFDNRKKIVITDANPNVKYIANNATQRKVCNYKVDGGLINDNQEKCDYLLVAENYELRVFPDFFFVELKGQDISHAIIQLNRSVDILIENIDSNSVNCRLVMTKIRTPDIKSSDITKIEQRMKRLKGSFKKKNLMLEESI